MEGEALSRLREVFQRLSDNNLKLSPKKCHFLQGSVRFLGHVINQKGVAADPATVEVISNLPREALMEEDGLTPSVRKLKSFLNMDFSSRVLFQGVQQSPSPCLH